MNRTWHSLALTSVVLLAACSVNTQKNSKIIPAGEKATVGPLIYAVVDTQILPQLDEDTNTSRTPANRFYMVQLSVSNSSNADVPIPAVTLVDDSGQTYMELSDGTGVSNWLGVIRKVKPGDTELGNILFDAPSKHYRLRLTDDLDPAEVSIDLPLNFVHEQVGNLNAAPTDVTNAPLTAAPKKK